MICEIQKKLKAPKGQTNTFGGYQYRSCEDIVEAVKPLLFEHDCHLTLSDEMVCIGDRVYVKATATIKKGSEVIETAHGWAREALSKKGMDEAQVTGAASSYARKYALNGLLAIDDTKDADTMDNSSHGQPAAQSTQQPSQQPVSDDDKPWFSDDDLASMKPNMIAKIQSGERTPADIVKNLRNSFKVSKKMAEQIERLAA